MLLLRQRRYSMTKKKHTFKEIILSFIIVAVAFVIVICALSFPAFESIFGAVCSALLLISIQLFLMAYHDNKRNNNKEWLDSSRKKLLVKLLFCLIISVCMIFNVFSSHVNLVFKHLLELDALK